MPLRASASSCYRGKSGGGPRSVVAEANMEIPTWKQGEETKKNTVDVTERVPPNSLAGGLPSPATERWRDADVCSWCADGGDAVPPQSVPESSPSPATKNRLFAQGINRRGNPLWLPRLSTGPAERVIVHNDPNIAPRPFAAPSGRHGGLPLRVSMGSYSPGASIVGATPRGCPRRPHGWWFAFGRAAISFGFRADQGVVCVPGQAQGPAPTVVGFLFAKR